MILPLINPAQAQDSSEVPDRGTELIPVECMDPASGAPLETTNSECFNALLKVDGVRKALKDPNMVPGIASGLVTIKDLKFNAKAADKVGRDSLGGTRPEIHNHRNDYLLDPSALEELKNARGFDIKQYTMTGQGPSKVQPVPPPPPGPFPEPPLGWVPSPDNPNYLDIPSFREELHDTLKSSVNGYAMKMRRNGQTVGILQWNWSRNPNVGDSPAEGWNTDRRMHVASISKLMSAIGLIHLLDEEGISPDTAIIDYLPDYWDPGANVENITFEDLMNHASGFVTGGSASDWATMKSTVESPVAASAIGDVDAMVYENMNFGLIRILISTIGGYISPAANLGSDLMNDNMWDASTAEFYNDYMQQHVFNPVGAFPTLSKNATTARAYTFNANGSGWNTGDFTNRAGGMGWHMTITEILDVVRALRAGQILDNFSTAKLLNESWGLNSPVFGASTDAGRTFYKAGLWTDNLNFPSIARTEQCFVFMMPDDMELVVFVNSEIGSTGQNLTSIVRTAYNNNIVIVP
ncbi:serine hydrolase domain-containing protein [Oceanicoccus sagamiensis]|uniref:Beta-lactamase-related domain-containing protein n=1 Tax=Oceanicoccus sagamiensis TaxID=716816 RepID=A0A1X9NC11_9GAMM|nr:serine hydrolase domain-containing protein [Oceanicoccus sagamiensis]ARN75136.1 hypothetical protein BST96_14030 [Oceanicoccus sagamiensis]